MGRSIYAVKAEASRRTPRASPPLSSLEFGEGAFTNSDTLVVPIFSSGNHEVLFPILMQQFRSMNPVWEIPLCFMAF
jgi:hypothetical protein